MVANGWKHAALLGTRWTMTGPVYAKAIEKRGLSFSIPDEPIERSSNAAIFDELCQGIFRGADHSVSSSTRSIDLRARGADCAILGCTEIPLIVSPENSSLPMLDSTRLLARYAVAEALNDRPIGIRSGWLPPTAIGSARAS